MFEVYPFLPGIHIVSINALMLIPSSCRVNSALEDALLEIADVTIPETLVMEQAREKFAIMMSEMRDQGESDEKIRSLITKEVGCVLLRSLVSYMTMGLFALLHRVLILTRTPCPLLFLFLTIPMLPLYRTSRSMWML